MIVTLDMQNADWSLVVMDTILSPSREDSPQCKFYKNLIMKFLNDERELFPDFNGSVGVEKICLIFIIWKCLDQSSGAGDLNSWGRIGCIFHPSNSLSFSRLVWLSTYWSQLNHSYRILCHEKRFTWRWPFFECSRISRMCTARLFDSFAPDMKLNKIYCELRRLDLSLI